jgi:hypothetical protein
MQPQLYSRISKYDGTTQKTSTSTSSAGSTDMPLAVAADLLHLKYWFGQRWSFQITRKVSIEHGYIEISTLVGTDSREDTFLPVCFSLLCRLACLRSVAR